MGSPKSFYLLEHFQTYPVTNAEAWLGRVVNDFRRPVAGYTPRTDLSGGFKWHIDPDFSNVEAVIESISSDAVKLSLLDVFGISHQDFRSRGNIFRSRKVARYRVHHDAEVLEKVMRDPDVTSDLDKWGFSIWHPLYLIVGFLVADEVKFDAKLAKDFRQAAQVDPIQIAGLASGVTPALILPPSEVGASYSRGSRDNLSAVANGTRIFAIEYRSFRKRLGGSTSKAASLHKHGPQGDRMFSSKDSDTSGPVQVHISLDTEDFAEIVESIEDDVGDRQMCFTLSGKEGVEGAQKLESPS